MGSYFNKDGTLTPEGENLLIHYRGAIESLFDTEECTDLSLEETKWLQKAMLTMLNDRCAKRITHKQKLIDRLNEMSQEEFEAYLQEKYGSVWQFLTLSHEELARVPKKKK